MSTIINHAERTVSVGDLTIRPTKTEFEITAYLAAHPGMHRSRLQIMDAIEYPLENNERSIDSHIKRIRRKGISEIETSNGIGYYWKSQARAETKEIRAMREAERLCHDLSDHLIRAGGQQAVLIAAQIPQSLKELLT